MRWSRSREPFPRSVPTDVGSTLFRIPCAGAADKNADDLTREDTRDGNHQNRVRTPNGDVVTLPPSGGHPVGVSLHPRAVPVDR